MAAYPRNENERRISFRSLHELVTAIFVRCGMSEADAGLLADTLAVADVQGVFSHGTMRVPDYVHKLTRGGVNPRGRPHVVSQTGAALVVDGDNGMGQIAARFAMKRAVEVAREHGLGAVAIRGSNHCGALAYFTRMAAAAQMIGLCTTNALPTMAPWGGADKILGMNPMSIAIPAGKECPIVFDAAFAASSHGKIRVYQQKGVPIPEGWAYDAEGRPTTDPTQAILGLLQPSGGHKGVALALSMGILSSLLSGAGYGLETGNMTDGPIAGTDGHFVLSVNVQAFVSPTEFNGRVDGIVAQIHGSRRAPGVDRLLVPGELEVLTEREYREHGIPLNDATLAGLRAEARKLGVSTAALDEARPGPGPAFASGAA